MYKAIIKEVEKKDDSLVITVEYSEAEELFTRTYSYGSKGDVDRSFDLTIKSELSRLDGLNTVYTEMLSRKELEIVKDEIVKDEIVKEATK